MVKYREILRLAAMGVSQDGIAYSCGCARSTVSDVLGAARARGMAWPLPEEVDDATVRSVICPNKARKSKDRATIDHGSIAAELGKRGMTMSPLWNEYRDAAIARGEEPCMYPAFCRGHRGWAQSHDVRMRIEHRPAEAIQVDWVGDTGGVIDPDTGEVPKVCVFAACPPRSSYLYAEGLYKTDEESWADAHVHMFAFFGGSTPILAPDNCRTATTRNARDALIVDEQCRRMSEHYGCAVVPARVRKPRDKASVEMGVGVIERQAMMALRKRRFMSLSGLNRALIARVMAIDSRPFQKREGSREGIFLGQEKPMLIPLPGNPYEMSARKGATVNFNCHVAFGGPGARCRPNTSSARSRWRPRRRPSRSSAAASASPSTGAPSARAITGRTPSTCPTPTATTPSGTATASAGGRPRSASRPGAPPTPPSRPARSSSSPAARAAECSRSPRRMGRSSWGRLAPRRCCGRRAPATRP